MQNSRLVKSVLALAIVAGLTGCLKSTDSPSKSNDNVETPSGGGGGDQGGSGDNGGGDPTPTTQRVSRVSLSGLVAGVSGSAATASAAAAQQGNPELANASVRAEVYGKSGALLTTLAATTDDEGRFQLRLPEYEYTVRMTATVLPGWC